jgi:hypothetical protein
MRMGSDEQPSGVCLLNDRTQLLDRELSSERIGARRANTTTSHDLHDVHTPLGAVPHRPAQLIDAPGLATHMK